MGERTPSPRASVQRSRLHLTTLEYPLTVLTSLFTDTDHEAAHEALKRFVLEHADALLSASALLGGPLARRRTARLLEALLERPSLTRHLRRELEELHSLLSRDRTGGPEGLEVTDRFAALDPASPVLEDISLLRDAFRTQIEAFDEAKSGDFASARRTAG